MLSLSVSRIDAYNQCAQLYDYIYNQKLPRKIAVKFDAGTFVHKVYELWGRCYKKQKSIGRDPDTRSILKWAYNTAYKDKEVGIQFARLPRESKIEVKQWIRDFADEYENKDLEILTVEKWFDFIIDGRFRVRGLIDRIDKVNDTTVRVIDYKTTRTKAFLSEFQLGVYALAIREVLHFYGNIESTYILLRHNLEQNPKLYTQSDIDDIRSQIIEVGNTIEQNQVWTPTPSFLCGYCDFLKQCNRDNKDFFNKW